MAAGKPTIDDVAALSGVARATVSRVLNGGVNVSADVRTRVMAAIEALDYQVNMQARALAGGKAQLLGLVYASDPDTEPNSFYHSGLELGALRACAEAGLQLMLHAVRQNSGDPAADILARLDAQACVGLILTPPFSDDVELVHRVMERNLPVVCIAPGPQARLITAGVGMDEARAGYDLTRHLLELGHRRFGFIKGIAGHLSAEERYAGFQRALDEAGVAADEVVSERGNFTFRSGVEQTAVILKRDRAAWPTALICANDDMAVGALFTAHRLGLSIPDDLSVAGFDDTPLSEIIWPPLTTVHQPLKVMGSRAVERIVADLKAMRQGQSLGQNLGKSQGGARFESVAHRVVVRESAARVGQIKLL